MSYLGLNPREESSVAVNGWDRSAGSKIRCTHTGLPGLRSCRLDSVAESSEFPDHSRRALLLPPFADDCAAFLVTDSLVQDQSDQSTMSMGDQPDGLLVSHARDRAAIDNLEDTSFGLYCGI